MPTVSVVIPAKNRAKMIGKCLDSVLNQTVKADEIIVVDDNSTDDTKEVVQSYSKYGVKYIPLENKTGAQAARNLGIISATGDYIAFQDSDDEWLPDKLERQIKELGKVNFNPMTVVHGNAIVKCEGEKERIWEVPETAGENVLSMLLKRPAPFFPAILTSKKALEKIGLLDEKVSAYQEWDTSIQLSKICRFIHIKKPIFIYNIHAGEAISKNGMGAIAGYKYIIDKYKDDIIAKCGEKAWYFHNFELSILCVEAEVPVPENISSVVKEKIIVYNILVFIGGFDRKKKLLRWFENVVRVICLLK